MPADTRRRVAALSTLLLSVQVSAALVAERAVAAPTPTPSPSPSPGRSNDPCDLIHGPTREFCEKDKLDGTSRSVDPLEPGGAVDPLSSPAALVSQGIKTHSARSHQQGAGGVAVSGGVAAHGNRGTHTGAPAGTPPPRTAPSTPATVNSPHTSRGIGNTGNTSNNSPGGGGR